jgi:hypothetical protein
VVAGALAAGLAALLLAAAAGAYTGLFLLLPRFVAEHRAMRAERQPAYQWIAANTPRDAAVLAYLDPILYLNAGRKACRLVLSPALIYRGDRPALQRFFAGLADFARQQKLSYALLTPSDLFAELPDEDCRAAVRMFRADPHLHLLYQSGDVSVCGIEVPLRGAGFQPAMASQAAR